MLSDIKKRMLIKELREYLNKAEQDETTHCEILMEIRELLEWIN